MIIQLISQRLNMIKRSIFKNTLILAITFLTITTNCLAIPSDLKKELINIDIEDAKSISSTIEFTLQHENDYMSSLDPAIVTLIQHNYPDYKFYSCSCTEHYTQTATDEYLIPMLSLTTKSIKNILLIATKNGSYEIKEFGNLKLTGENSGWLLTMCGNTTDIFKHWKSKDPEREKWFRKPLNNGLGYFCVMRDDSPYLDTCYQYNKKYQAFNRIYGTYFGDY